jgi:transcriptional regulator with XRE-family HTH domain
MKTIKQLREGRGWTQLELAIKLGVQPMTVSAWERGRSDPSAVKLRDLARVFEVDMGEIILPSEQQGERAA